MNNDEKAYLLAKQKADECKCVIKSMHLVDGKYWFAPLPKDLENAKKTYDVNGAYMIDPSNWTLSFAHTFEMMDAIDEAKSDKKFDLSQFKEGM